MANTEDVYTRVDLETLRFSVGNNTLREITGGLDKIEAAPLSFTETRALSELGQTANEMASGLFDDIELQENTEFVNEVGQTVEAPAQDAGLQTREEFEAEEEADMAEFAEVQERANEIEDMNIDARTISIEQIGDGQVLDGVGSQMEDLDETDDADHQADAFKAAGFTQAEQRKHAYLRNQGNTESTIIDDSGEDEDDDYVRGQRYAQALVQLQNNATFTTQFKLQQELYGLYEERDSLQDQIDKWMSEREQIRSRLPAVQAEYDQAVADAAQSRTVLDKSETDLAVAVADHADATVDAQTAAAAEDVAEDNLEKGAEVFYRQHGLTRRDDQGHFYKRDSDGREVRIEDQAEHTTLTTQWRNEVGQLETVEARAEETRVAAEGEVVSTGDRVATLTAARDAAYQTWQVKQTRADTLGTQLQTMRAREAELTGLIDNGNTRLQEINAEIERKEQEFVAAGGEITENGPRISEEVLSTLSAEDRAMYEEYTQRQESLKELREQQLTLNEEYRDLNLGIVQDMVSVQGINNELDSLQDEIDDLQLTHDAAMDMADKNGFCAIRNEVDIDKAVTLEDGRAVVTFTDTEGTVHYGTLEGASGTEFHAISAEQRAYIDARLAENPELQIYDQKDYDYTVKIGAMKDRTEYEESLNEVDTFAERLNMDGFWATTQTIADAEQTAADVQAQIQALENQRRIAQLNAGGNTAALNLMASENPAVYETLRELDEFKLMSDEEISAAITINQEALEAQIASITDQIKDIDLEIELVVDDLEENVEAQKQAEATAEWAEGNALVSYDGESVISRDDRFFGMGLTSINADGTEEEHGIVASVAGQFAIMWQKGTRDAQFGTEIDEHKENAVEAGQATEQTQGQLDGLTADRAVLADHKQQFCDVTGAAIDACQAKVADMELDTKEGWEDLARDGVAFVKSGIDALGDSLSSFFGSAASEEEVKVASNEAGGTAPPAVKQDEPSFLERFGL